MRSTLAFRIAIALLLLPLAACAGGNDSARQTAEPLVAEFLPAAFERPVFGTISGRVCNVVKLDDATSKLRLGFSERGIAVPITEEQIKLAANKGISAIDGCFYRISTKACASCGVGMVYQHSSIEAKWYDLLADLTATPMFEPVAGLGETAFSGSHQLADGRWATYLIVRDKPWVYGVAAVGIPAGEIPAAKAGAIELVNRFLPLQHQSG